MPRLKVTITEEVDVPEGTSIALAPTGVVAGLQLPGGELVKPWTSWELFPDASGHSDAIGDLDHDELLARGVATGLDYDRSIEAIDTPPPVGQITLGS